MHRNGITERKVVTGERPLVAGNGSSRSSLQGERGRLGSQFKRQVTGSGLNSQPATSLRSCVPMRPMQDDAYQLWSFDEIAAVDLARAMFLESAPSAEEIAARIVSRFEAALASGDVRIALSRSRERPPDSRLVVQFHVGERLYDWFFNARTGYRAQFRHGSEHGRRFNRALTCAIRDILIPQSPATITVRSVVGDFEDVGTTEIRREEAAQSLDPELSKLWCCGTLLLADGRVRQMIPSGSGPKLQVDATTRWPAIVASDPDSWLELNGAFLGPDGPYQVKALAVREQSLQARGEA